MMLLRSSTHDRATNIVDTEATASADLTATIASLRALLADVPVPVVFWDRSFTLRWANRAYLDFFETTLTAVAGRVIDDLWRGLEPRDLRERQRRVLAGLPAARAELAYPHSGGMTYWALSDTPVRDEVGAIVGGLSIAQEITAGVVARRETEAERQRLRDILDVIPIAVSVWRGDRRLAFLNATADAYWRRVGEPLAEGALPPRVDLRHLDGRPLRPEEDPIIQARQRGELVQSPPLTIRMADGSTEPIVITAVPLMAETGEAPAMIAIGHDPSPEWEQRRLAEMARVKAHLLAWVSHEARAPLGHILGYAEALARGDAALGEDERREGLDMIQASAWQLQRLIDDLLDASRIEAGGLPVVLGTVDLTALAVQVVERARRAAPDRALNVTFPANVPSIPGDAGRIEQVLENLVGNALRHALGAAITIGGRVRRDAVEVWVRDTGPGFPPERLADPFAARPGARPGGLGLGLSICRGIVEAHGGAIWIVPRRRGTAVHIRLPRRWQGPSTPEIDHEPAASLPSRQ